VADQYIDSAYVDALLGRGFRTAVEDLEGANLFTLIEGGTALVQSYLRNQGYSTPTTTTDETVKLATLACVAVSMFSIPEFSFPKPESWDMHPAKLALDGILSGDAQVTHGLTQISAEGGLAFSSSTTYPQRASRTNLGGY
jgi:hypothetical protein